MDIIGEALAANIMRKHAMYAIREYVSFNLYRKYHTLQYKLNTRNEDGRLSPYQIWSYAGCLLNCSYLLKQLATMQSNPD